MLVFAQKSYLCAKFQAFSIVQIRQIYMVLNFKYKRDYIFLRNKSVKDLDRLGSDNDYSAF